MKSVITIKAWRRPEMLYKVLHGLSHCNFINQFQVALSIDKSNINRHEFKDVIKRSGLIKKAADIKVFYQNQSLGCAGNMKFCLKYAFEELKVDYMIHLEDDTIPAGDFLRFMKWSCKYIHGKDNIFAVCPFTRRTRTIVPAESLTLEHLNRIYYYRIFESGGGYGITRNKWELIKSKGGPFGSYGNNKHKGEEWKKKIIVRDDGSWAWPFNQYFITTEVCLFPLVSRSQNIGDKEGKFNPSPKWHKDRIFQPAWVGHPTFKNVDWNNIEYSTEPWKRK